MRHFQSILFVLCILAGISSCNTISDEWQNFVSSGLSDSTEVHTCTLYLDAARPSFDEKESGNTRASGGRWEDGDVVYLSISKSSVYGQGVYSARNNTWTFEYVGSINAIEGRCSTIYCNGYQSFDKKEGEISVNEHTAIYKDDNATYEYRNGRLYLTSNLAPCCFRMRLKGLAPDQSVTLKKSENLSYYNTLSLSKGRTSYERRDVIMVGGEDSYSDYVYAFTPSSTSTYNRNITIESGGKFFSRIVRSIGVGDSGVLSVPTLSAHAGWDDISNVATIADGWTFNETIKRLANGADEAVDYAIQEIIFDCGSDVQSGTLVSAEESLVPIYASFSNGVVTVSTKGEIIKASEMHQMFSGCQSLTSIDLSSFDTSNVTDMSAMFHGCQSLTSIDLSSFDTSNVFGMDWLFSDCCSLTSLDLSSFDTSNVFSMSNMFYGCRSLTSIDLSHFDTSNVSYMSYLFGECQSLTSIDLSSFDTSNVTDMAGLFSSCWSLTSIDLSSFDTSNVTNMGSMFAYCYRLSSISCLASTKNALLNSDGFPIGADITWKLLDSEGGEWDPVVDIDPVVEIDPTKWYIVKIRTNKYFKASLEDSCLYATTELNPIITDEYLWRFIENSDGTYTIVNKAFGMNYAVCSATELDEDGEIKMKDYSNAEHYKCVSATGGYYFIPKSQLSGSTIYINDAGMSGHILYNWSDDDGSVLRLYNPENYDVY